MPYFQQSTHRLSSWPAPAITYPKALYQPEVEDGSWILLDFEEFGTSIFGLFRIQPDLIHG